MLFLPCTVDDVQQADGCMALRCNEEGNGQQHVARCRLVTLASGAAAGRFLEYEADAPRVAAQTAYGIEAYVEGYDQVGRAPRVLCMHTSDSRHTRTT